MDIAACGGGYRAINPVIDQADPISQSYYLEGGARPWPQTDQDSHFAAKCGQKVLAHLIRANEAGEREVTGILRGKEGTVVTLGGGRHSGGHRYQRRKLFQAVRRRGPVLTFG